MDRVSRYWVNCRGGNYIYTDDRFTINHAGGYRTEALMLSFEAFSLLAIL